MKRSSTYRQMDIDTNPDSLQLVEGEPLAHAKTGKDYLVAYVDGSITCPKDDKPTAPFSGGFAVVFVSGSGVSVYGNASVSNIMYSRSQDAELCGAMAAMRYAFSRGYRNIHVKYDCTEIENIYSGYTQKLTYPSARTYKKFIKKLSKKGNVRLTMSHVKSHSHQRFNTIADKTANKLRLRIAKER